MVIAQITGGLGNQLFQYSAAKSLSLYHNTPLMLEVSSFYREELPDLEVPRDFELFHFEGINEEIISPEDLAKIISLNKKSILPKKMIPAHRKEIYTEAYYHFDKKFFNARNKVFLKGGWQSEKYFKKHEKAIRNNLRLKPALFENVIEKAKTIKQQNSVAVHIRRGDYLRKKIIYEWHGVMNKDYYEKAFQLLSSRVKDLKIYYFTDDPDWVNNTLMPSFNGEILSGSITTSHLEDFYLMSKCRHNIIANSSFSWWGAWLNDNPNKIVIAPEKWFGNGPKDIQDIIPVEWCKI